MSELHRRTARMGPIADPRPRIGALLADPAVSASLKLVLKSWSTRDPMDAACDASLLALALERVADERCGRNTWWAWRGGTGGADDSHRI